MPANQRKVRAKLAAWLQEKLDKLVYTEIKSEALVKQFKKDDEEQIKKFIVYLENNGHCHGFALSRGAMAAIHRDEWWDEIFNIIETTSIYLSDFTAKIKLKHSEKETTLEDIFFTALYQIVPAQVYSDDAFINKFRVLGVTQRNYLNPETSQFQMLGKLPELKIPKDAPDVLLTVKDRKSSGCHFSPVPLQEEKKSCNLTDLEKKVNKAEPLFNLTDTIGKIGLIHNINHTIQFNIKNGKYFLYDSNYTDKIYSCFDTKKEFLKEVFEILGDSFAFDIVSLNKKLSEDLFSYCDEMIKEKPLELIKEYGLIMVLDYLLEKVDALVNNICTSTDKNGPDYVVQALKITDRTYNGLFFFAENKPDLLIKLLNYAKRSKNYSDSIAEALGLKTKSHASVLANVAIKLKKDLAELLADAEKGLHWRNYLLCGLEAKDEQGKNGFLKMVNDKSVDLQAIIEAAAKHESTAEFIRNTLANDIGEGWIMFHKIVFNHPKSLPALFKLLGSTKEGCDKLATLLSTQTVDGWSGLTIVFKYARDSLSEALEVAGKSESFVEHLAKGLLIQTDNNATACHIATENPDSFRDMVRLGRKYQTIANAITCASLTKNKKGVMPVDTRMYIYQADEFLIEERYIATALENDVVFDYILQPSAKDHLLDTPINPKKIIHEALLQSDKNGDWCGLLIDEPKLKRALKLVEDAKDWPDSAAKILQMKNKRGESVLLELVCAFDMCEDITLFRLLSSAVECKEGRVIDQQVKMLTALHEDPLQSIKGIQSVAESKEQSCPEPLLSIFMDPAQLKYLINHSPNYVMKMLSYLQALKSEKELVQLLELILTIDKDALVKIPKINSLILHFSNPSVIAKLPYSVNDLFKKYNDLILSLLTDGDDVKLNTFLADADQSADWPEYLFDFLNLTHKGELSRFTKMVCDHSFDLGRIFDVAAKYDMLTQAIVEVLPVNINEKWILFHYIVSYHPESLPSLFKLLAKSINGCDILAKLLPMQTSDKWSGLAMLSQHAQRYLVEAIECAEKSKSFFELFAKALVVQTELGSTVCHLTHNHYSARAKFMDLGKTSSLIANAITCSLLTKNYSGIRPGDKIPSYTITERFLNEKQYIATALEYDTVFDYLIQPKVTDIVTKLPIDAEKIINVALSQTDKMGDWMGLLIDKPKLMKALNFAEKSKQWPEYAVKVLLSKNKRGESVIVELLQAMEMFADEALERLIKFALKSENCWQIKNALQELKSNKNVPEQALKKVLTLVEPKEEKSSSFHSKFFKPVFSNPIIDILGHLDKSPCQNYDFLMKIAMESPKNAELILQDFTLRDRLLSNAYEAGGKSEGGKITVSYVLKNIAQSYPASAKLILEDGFLRGELLGSDSSSRNHALDNIALAHTSSQQIQELCEKHRHVSIYRRLWS